MGQQLLLYGQALLANWFYVVTGGAPLLLDQLLQFGSDRWRKWVETKGPWRRRLEVSFLLGAVVWAGFQAWQDEYKSHQADLQSLASLQRQADGMRLDIYGNSVFGGLKGRVSDLERENTDLRQQLANAQARPPQIVERDRYLPAPPVRIDVHNPEAPPPARHLKNGGNDFVAALSPLAKDIPTIVVFSTGGAEESRYAFELIAALKKAGIVGTLATSVSANETEVGLMIGVADPTKPPELAKRFMTALRNAGLDPHFTLWTLAAGSEAFDIFVGPQN